MFLFLTKSSVNRVIVSSFMVAPSPKSLVFEDQLRNRNGHSRYSGVDDHTRVYPTVLLSFGCSVLGVRGWTLLPTRPSPGAFHHSPVVTNEPKFGIRTYKDRKIGLFAMQECATRQQLTKYKYIP